MGATCADRSHHQRVNSPHSEHPYFVDPEPEIAKRVNPILLATAGPAPQVRGRVAFDRYVARLAV